MGLQEQMELQDRPVHRELMGHQVQVEPTGLQVQMVPQELEELTELA